MNFYRMMMKKIILKSFCSKKVLKIMKNQVIANSGSICTKESRQKFLKRESRLLKLNRSLMIKRTKVIRLSRNFTYYRVRIKLQRSSMLSIYIRFKNRRIISMLEIKINRFKSYQSLIKLLKIYTSSANNLKEIT